MREKTSPQHTAIGATMSAKLNKDMEVVTLPNFLSLEDTATFNLYLKEHTERYGVKKLLYHTEMIENHLKRIAILSDGAQKILVRVNGDITSTQKQFYTERVAKTVARKFYNSMSDKALAEYACSHGLRNYRYSEREELIEQLVKVHVDNVRGE